MHVVQVEFAGNTTVPAVNKRRRGNKFHNCSYRYVTSACISEARIYDQADIGLP